MNVRYWPADIRSYTAHVRFWGQSGHGLLGNFAFAICSSARKRSRVRQLVLSERRLISRTTTPPGSVALGWIIVGGGAGIGPLVAKN